MQIGKLFSIDGRVGRRPYWLGSLLAVGSYLLLSIGLSGNLGAVTAIGAVLLVLIGIVNITLGVRRCHDRNKSGWWLLIGIIPILGGLWLLIDLGILPGSDGPNQYGLPGSGSPSRS